MRRNEALKAKNRRAQARYRERQKEKFADYKSAVDELTQQLESLAAEKDALAADKAMLESCLQLSYQKGLSGGDDSPDTASTSEAYQHAIWKSTSIDEALLEAMMSVFTKARMACKLQPLSQQDIENTSLDEVFQRKELTVNGTAALLRHVDEEGTEAAFHKLVEFMAAQAHMYDLLYTHHGQLARVMEASLVHTSRQRHGLPQPNFWASVLEALTLTDAQRVRMLQLRRQLLTRMEDVRQRRVSILESLQGTLPTGLNRESGLSFASTFVQGTQAAELLRESLHQEHRTTHEFTSTIRRKVLSPYQTAILEVRSFPYKVDLLAICNAIPGQAPSVPQSQGPSPPTSGAQLLGLHESPSGLDALNEFTSEHLSALHSGSLSQEGLLAAPPTKTEPFPAWMHAVARTSSPQATLPHRGAGGIPAESPAVSLQLRGSEMDALLLDL